jgi:hypothetical protein
MYGHAVSSVTLVPQTRWNELMETTERIVEAYARYIRDCATLPNIRCEGQMEIDLLAIGLKSGERYHIESGVSGSGSYSKLTNEPYDPEELKRRVKTAGQRRTLGYFRDRKFGDENVINRLKDFGFVEGDYKKVIVTWGWREGVEEAASEDGIVLWDFRSLIDQIAQCFTDRRSYFGDDTLRTLHLYALAQAAAKNDLE